MLHGKLLSHFMTVVNVMHLKFPSLIVYICF